MIQQPRIAYVKQCRIANNDIQYNNKELLRIAYGIKECA